MMHTYNICYRKINSVDTDNTIITAETLEDAKRIFRNGFPNETILAVHRDGERV